MFVKAFLAQAAVKRFDKCVLNRLARLDEFQPDLVIASPLVKYSTGELGTVVDLDGRRQTANEPQSVEYPFYPLTIKRYINFNRQALTTIRRSRQGRGIVGR